MVRKELLEELSTENTVFQIKDCYDTMVANQLNPSFPVNDGMLSDLIVNEKEVEK